MVKEETADTQIRVSRTTLEIIERLGIYSDKTSDGVLKRILPEYEELKKTCGVPEKKVATEETEEASTSAPEATGEEKPEDETPE